jgi:hypothetical protein
LMIDPVSREARVASRTLDLRTQEFDLYSPWQSNQAVFLAANNCSNSPGVLTSMVKPALWMFTSRTCVRSSRVVL